MKLFTGRFAGGVAITNAFLSFPAYFSLSSSEQPASSNMARPETVPMVLADHACGTAATMNGTGVVAMSEKRSFSQPSPAGVSHFSSCTLARPHDFIWPIAQSRARDAFGDQVRRGP